MNHVAGKLIVSGAAIALARPQHVESFCAMMTQLDLDFADTRELGWQALETAQDVVSAFVEHSDELDAEIEFFAKKGVLAPALA
jgi:hypothetical protein